jgi:arylsulfatase A-like enzyme
VILWYNFGDEIGSIFKIEPIYLFRKRSIMSNRPNILIFMTDQQQVEVTAPDHPCLTPNADRLAREGVRFTQTYCPSPHCCPSRATFMTGLYPSRHGIFNNVLTPTAINFGLNEGVVTFSEQLRAAGYQLNFAGKWHVTAEENPADRGWDELHVTGVKGTAQQHDIGQWHRQAELQEMDEPRQRGHIQRPGWGDFVVYKTLPNGGPKGYEALNDYKVVRSATEALPKLAQSEQPWMLYVGTIGPHDPFNVPQRFVDMYDPAQIELPPSYTDSLTDKPRIYQRQRQQLWDQLTEAEVRESIAHYWAYCTLQDALLGEVLDALEATGQVEDTLVIFMSDHGDYCGAHGLYLKGVPAFREAYHVPCIARWPKGIAEPGREVDAFVSLADFAPTFMELAEAETPSDLSGRSLSPFLQNQAPSDWREAIHTQLNGVELYYTQRSVTTREYKYVYNGFDFDELYALQQDPHELVNLADDPDYQAVKLALVKQMWQFAAQEEDIIFNPYGTVALAPWGPAEGLRE